MKKILKGIIIAILKLEARIVLKIYKPNIIAVTGSVGKTGTKDAIYSALSKSIFVRKSEKSHNNDIGIPLTVLGLPNAWANPSLWLKNILDGLSLILNNQPYPKWLILEIGSDHPGDVRKLGKWIKPKINVITAFPSVPVHVEFFSSPEALNAEDAELSKILETDDFLVLNHDDPAVLSLKNDSKAKIITYGFSEGSSVKAEYPLVLYEGEKGHERPTGMTLNALYEGLSLPLQIHGVLGKNAIYSALAALSVGKALGINSMTMIEGLSSHTPPPGRLRLISGNKNTVLIDDTYNSSPIAAETALEAFKNLNVKGRKIAVLGDMLELGKYSAKEHLRIGELAGKICDILITVGIRAQGMAEGALSVGMKEKNIFQYEDSIGAGEFLESILKSGDTVLFKASQSIRLERAVEKVMMHPEDKESLLCRQEKEWQLKKIPVN